ncbi:hypothetical protein [Ammoniphilus sp. 3BR4]|uniref:hypothetical protein n=1 Tax=Ammoniphilus sp. 3BR4 TaxID=3158265 RepID=UPI00346587ED
MDEYRNKKYSIKKFKEDEVIHMITVHQSPTVRKVKKEKFAVKNKKNVSARDIQHSIGIYGSFGRTLVDLHNQGR